ncbi:MAG: hypothetical protein ACD_65C00376G0014 [uncultured bacterium]|nr:MAG: hypothetical protein ACD_65C00376G0014 [uncultured bacterium]
MIDEFLLQPDLYSTHGSSTLIDLLEKQWIDDINLGEGTIYLVSGFGNYNGGVRFYDHFKSHVDKGGHIKSLFGGSTSQRLTSMQLAEGLLNAGVQVNIVNRKHILHAKCYGYQSESKQSLIVTSGNFTGPGLSQNVEVAVSLSNESVNKIGFKWDDFFSACLKSSEGTYLPTLPVGDSVDWRLLYNEVRGQNDTVPPEEKVTMLLLLSHADTARINSRPGESSGKGSQYFWLSKSAFNFFPALTIPNERGSKPTYSTIIKVKYVDLNLEENSRVTFEAGNNLDFRLGTGALRYSHLADEFDIAAITRRKNAFYEIRIFKKSSKHYSTLSKYLINYIGSQGKKYGYIPNDIFDSVITI